MKVLLLLFFSLIAMQAQAQSACRCTCAWHDRNLCASNYDLDKPCGVLCPSNSPALPPMGKTACPTARVFNLERGIYEWRVFCPD